MTTPFIPEALRRCGPAGFALLTALPLMAFPPAPHHVLHGLVRDEYGVPLTGADTELLLQLADTPGAPVLSTGIDPAPTADGNYRFKLAMDTVPEAAPDLYKATALRPFAAYRIRVRVGTATYLPMELVGNVRQLGRPAARTRLDLTLGEDANGDGLPDAWQRLLASRLPGARVGPNDDADGDGLSNYDEYLAGTYAFEPSEGFRIELKVSSNGKPTLDFTAVANRTYTLQHSVDLKNWTPLSFRLAEGGPSVASHRATDTRVLEVEPELPDGTAAAGQFFRVRSH